MHQLMQDEVDAAANEEEKLMIIFCPLHLRPNISASPRQGCSTLGKKKKNMQQRMQGVALLWVLQNACVSIVSGHSCEGASGDALYALYWIVYQKSADHMIKFDHGRA
jgi:hypothetical protein